MVFLCIIIMMNDWNDISIFLSKRSMRKRVCKVMQGNSIDKQRLDFQFLTIRQQIILIPVYSIGC